MAPLPKISVLVCTFNRAHLLPDAIASLLRQTGITKDAYEIVIVDDGSTDETPEVIESISASSPVCITAVRGGHCGLGAARNLSLAHARGDWVAFFDDDQVADTRWLAELLRAAEGTTGVDAVAGRIVPVIVGAAPFRLTSTVRRLLGEKSSAIHAMHAPGMIPSTGNVLVRRQLFEEVGCFDDSLNCGEDTEFFRRARRRRSARYVYADAACITHTIPSSRLVSEHLTAYAQEVSVSQIAEDWKDGGTRLILMNSALRLAHLVVVVYPQMIWAMIVGDQGVLVGRRCSTAYNKAYCLEALRHLFLKRRMG